MTISDHQSAQEKAKSTPRLVEGEARAPQQTRGGRRKDSLSFPSDPLPEFPTTTQQPESRKTVALIDQVSCGESTGRGGREELEAVRGWCESPKAPSQQCIKNWKLSTFPKGVFSLNLMVLRSGESTAGRLQ